MSADDPRRHGARQTFLDTVLTQCGVGADQHHDVGHGGTTLSAYRLTPASPRGVIVVFGGFDSYIEEWLPMLLALHHAGLDVVAFDGPGQGAALEAGLPMTAQWHKPVGAVLDHFGVDDVTLMGFSLGGCLVMRAAAYEPRVSLSHRRRHSHRLRRLLRLPVGRAAKSAGRGQRRPTARGRGGQVDKPGSQPGSRRLTGASEMPKRCLESTPRPRRWPQCAPCAPMTSLPGSPKTCC